MGDVRLTFDDGSVVRLHLASDTDETAPAPSSADSGDAAPQLPEGFGTARPVSADGRAAQALTRGGQALTDALRPLGGVLGAIHRSFTQFPYRPDDVTVEFGVTLGSDFSLGVFSGNGEASFTVSATWNLAGGAAEAQDTAGTGTGAASDPSHAVVPGQVNG
ncbi:CU044_2847 family protein [Streptomyces longwoodensis]|uniref:CU044_2847 family protein n=1 Tax=Streptomyces longwoodensis TaxID=68231 RepID=UPI0033F7BFB2